MLQHAQLTGRGQDHFAQLAAFAGLGLIVAGLALVFGFFLVWIMAWLTATPVRTVRAAQQRVEDGDLDASVVVFDGTRRKYSALAEIRCDVKVATGAAPNTTEQVVSHIMRINWVCFWNAVEEFAVAAMVTVCVLIVWRSAATVTAPVALTVCSVVSPPVLRLSRPVLALVTVKALASFT